MHRIILLITSLLTIIIATAQEAVVKRFEALPFEVIPAVDRRSDLNGEPCALIHVEVLADDVIFEGNIIGPVTHSGGEYRVFLSPGTKMMRIKSGSFLPLMLNFTDYGIKGVAPNAVYAITLITPRTETSKAAAKYNYLVLKVNPADATVTVDGSPREVINGTASVLLAGGSSYSYHVEAPGYLPEDGKGTIGSERVERTVNLRSSKGSLKIQTSTPSTEIFINGTRMGSNMWSGELMPDTYLIEGRLEGFHPVEEVVTISTGDSKTVTLAPLEAITGSLNINYQPAGATIAIDGKVRGTTPEVISDIPAGTHIVTISANGYSATSVNATITDGGMTEISGSLTKLTVPAIVSAAGSSQPAADQNNTPTSHAVKSEPISPFTKNGKWGYRQMQNGHYFVVIQPQYDLAGTFSEDLAWVKVNDKYGFINTDGKLVIPAIYESVNSFSEGLAAVKINGKFGFINKNGKMVIPAKYDWVSSFSNNRARVKMKGKYTFIDKKQNTHER